MPKIAEPFVTTAEDGPAYWQIGNLWRIMATGVQTDNAFTLIDQVVHSGGGGGPMTHTHSQDEGLYVISGRCTFNAGGHQGLPGTPGTLVHIPGDCEHSFTVDEPDTHVLNFYLPAGFEQLLIGVAHPAMTKEPPPQDKIGEMLPPRWLSEVLAQEYGMTNILGNPFADPPDPAKMMTRPTPGAQYFPFIANKATLDTFTAMNGSWNVLAGGKQTGSYILLEVTFGSGPVFGPRIYKDTDEMFYVIDGEMTFQLGSSIEKIKKGSLVYIPANTVYGAKVDSENARCLNMHTKAGFEDLIQLIGAKGEDADEGTKSRLKKRIGLQELDSVLSISW